MQILPHWPVLIPQEGVRKIIVVRNCHPYGKQNAVGHGLLCVDVFNEARDRCQLGIAARVEIYLTVPSASMVGSKDDTLMFEPGSQRYFGLHVGQSK